MSFKSKQYFVKKMQKTVLFLKILLAFLLFLCLLKMPYGFYQLVRFLAMLGFALLAYQASENQNKTEMVIYICLALLFQPFMKASLGRDLWNVIDLVVGAGLILSLLFRAKGF